jgi:hypothetical protein
MAAPGAARLLRQRGNPDPHTTLGLLDTLDGNVCQVR